MANPGRSRFVVVRIIVQKSSLNSLVIFKIYVQSVIENQLQYNVITIRIMWNTWMVVIRKVYMIAVSYR